MNKPSGYQGLSKEKFQTIQNWHVSTPQYTLHFHNTTPWCRDLPLKKYIKIDHKLFFAKMFEEISQIIGFFGNFNQPLGGPRCKFTHPSSKDAMVVVNGAVGSLGPTPGCWCDGHWNFGRTTWERQNPWNPRERQVTGVVLVGGVNGQRTVLKNDFQPDSAIGVRNFCV